MIANIRIRAILTVTTLLALAGCGGGTSGEGFEVPHTIRFDGAAASGEVQSTVGPANVSAGSQMPTAGPDKAKAATSVASDPVQVLRLVKVSETRVSRLVYDYAFEPVVKTDSARADVTLRLVGAGVGTTIIDAVSSAGSLPAAPELRLGDVVVLRVDRSKPFDTAALRWSVSSVALPVGSMVTTQTFGWEFLEGEDGSTQRPIRVLAGGNRTTGLHLTPLRQSAPPLSTLRWTIEDDALGAFSVTGTELGPRLSVSAGPAPAGTSLTATLRGIDMSTGTSIVRPVAAVVLPPDGMATAAIGAAGGQITTPLGVVEFLPNGLTEAVGVTLVWKVTAGEGAQFDVRFDREISQANVKFKLPTLPDLDALPNLGGSIAATTGAAKVGAGSAVGKKAKQAATTGDFCTESTGGTWDSATGLLSNALLERNAYFIDGWVLTGMRAKEGSPLAVSGVATGSKFTFAHNGWFKNTKTVEVIISVASSLHGSLRAAASCASDSALLMRKYDWSESEPVLFIHGFGLGNFLGGGSGTWDRFPALAAGVSSPNGKTLVPFEFRWRTNADFRTVASDLGRAINFLSRNSGGKKVHVVAHSFGGVVVRSLLQGLAYDIAGSSSLGRMQSGIDAVASLTSFGSPYSGIFDVATPVTTAGLVTYLPRGRDDWKISRCGQISCAQMGERVEAFNSDAAFLGFSGDELTVGSHAALIAQSTSKLPSIPIHVGVGLYRTNGIVQEGDNLISFAGQRFTNYPSKQAADDAALLNGERVGGGAAWVTEVILGELSTTRPGTATASPVVGSRTNGYIHSNGGFWKVAYSDGGDIWHHGLEAAVSEGCESVQGCKHDSFLLFRRAMNDLIGIGPSVPPLPMVAAKVLQVNPAVLGKLTANEVGQVQQILTDVQVGGWVSGSQVRWDLVPLDTASKWSILLQSMKGLALSPTQESQIQQRKDELKRRLSVIETFGNQYILDQNGWFVWDNDNVLAFRDILKESVLGGLAVAQFVFADAFTIADAATGPIDLSDAQIRAAVRIRASIQRLKFEEAKVFGATCMDAVNAIVATDTPSSGVPYDIGAFGGKLLPVVKCIAEALAEFGTMSSDTAKAWTKVLAASTDLGDGVSENLVTVVLDSGSALVDLIPASPVTTRIKAVLDFLSSSYKAIRTGVELANHNNSIFLDRIADARSLVDELRRTEEKLSNQRILAVRARDLFVTAPALTIGQVNKPMGAVQANMPVTWTAALVSTAVDVIWQFGSDVRQFFSTVSNQVAAVVDYVFRATGLQTVVATVKDATGRLIGMVITQVDVQPGPVVASVSPLVANAGVSTTFVVTGSNLPEGLSFQLNGCGTVSELKAGSSDAMRQFSCTVPVTAAAGLVDGAIGPRGSNGSPFGLALFDFKVKVIKSAVATVTALPSPSVGVRSVVSVSGSDLPGTANVLIDDATCEPATVVANGNGTGFTQSCTFGPKAGSKLVMVWSGPGPTGYVIDDTKTLTVGGAPVQPTTLFDDFAGTTVDATLWNIDGWNGTGNKYDNWSGPRVGTVTVANGQVQFGQVGRISTKGKVTFSGDAPIVIEGRMASSSALHSTNIMLVDTASGDQILMGDTNYANFGFYALGIGSYKLTDASLPGDTSNPLALGSSTTAFMEYRLTLDGNRVKIERGPTLNNITQTGTATLGRSIVGRTFHLSIGSDWAYYPATFDWVKARSPVTLFGTTSRPTQVADTGVTTCTDYAYSPYSLEHSSGLDCALLQDSRGDPIPARQDGATGRDALATKGQLTKIGSGPAGFDFTKLDESGAELPATATNWACVRDNHTRLVWENKSADGGLRDFRHRYSWYSTAADANGGSPGSEGSNTCGGTLGSTCNTQAYVAALSAARLCGGSTWRLPKLEELISIVNFSRASPAIDLDWFSNTEYTPPGRAAIYLTSNLYSANPTLGVMGLEFSYGLLNTPNKSSAYAVRAVMNSK